MAVRYPFASVGWRRRQTLNKVLLMIWMASFLLSIPVILTHTLGEVQGQNQCLFRKYETVAQEAVLLILESLIGFVIPFFTLLVCYGCLFSRIVQMNFKSKSKSTVLICSVVVMFAFCWIPHHVGNLLSLISLALKHSNPDMAESLEDARTTMTIIAGALVFISSSVNPVLYVFAARTFRSSLLETGIQKLFQHLSSAVSGLFQSFSKFISFNFLPLWSLMASHSDTLVVFFGATAGANGGKLGSDERELILLVWQIVDLHENKVGQLQRTLVQPDSADLSEQCKEETGLTAEELCKAEPLESVLQQ
ncbi:hypothetical protein cypCar_00047963, partial [Cyprinus carpio]